MQKKKIREKLGSKEKNKRKIMIIFGILLSLVVGTLTLFFSRSIATSLTVTLLVGAFLTFYSILKTKLKRTTRIKKMENAFPDFLQLMSSNLRAGMTIDKALLLSSRKEFAPLDKEILGLGKDIITGKKIEEALENMTKRINSEKINKTVHLITSGIRAGGNLAILLEQTASNMREKKFVEKKAASSVLMYSIFIFFAISIGAPMLFALSTVLIEVLTNILSTLPPSGVSARIPFTLSEINISVNFVTYFTLFFLLVTDILGSLVLGLISKGEEKAGIKFMIPLILISLVTFFAIKIVLGSYFSNAFG